MVFAVKLTVPPLQLPTTLGVADTAIPMGSGSLNATPVAETVLAAGLVMVKVTVEVPFKGILDGLNTLAIVGGDTTVRVAVLLAMPVPPLVEETAPVVLFLA